ncbi:MAG TPA: PP2C family protein-serine/threonine phosphatase [Acidobacteriota bacterium]|nr:PP2C family protein-serine/threonine phosphatase [Acidobacteriota bacterium]
MRKSGVSLIQTHLHALIRALALPEISLVELLGRANGLLNQATLPKAYATLVAGRLVTGGRVELANGGHPPPLLADARGVPPVKGGGLPLGLFREAGYDHRELFLKPGDTLFLYTDGLTEAATQEGEYGVSRAAASLRRHADLPLRELLSACRKDLRSFLNGAYSGDDFTLVAIRRME